MVRCNSKLLAHNDTNTPWTSQMITHLWTKWHDLWLLRNATNYGKDTTERLLIRKTFLMNEIDRLYKYKEDVCHEDRDIFRDTALQHQQEPLGTIAVWIKVFEPVIRLSRKQLKERNKADIRVYWVRNI